MNYLRRYKTNQVGGSKLKLIDFPFNRMTPKYSAMKVRWVVGDGDSGNDRLPMKDLRKIYKMIEKIYYYKEGWGTDNYLPYNEESEPCVMIARLKNGVMMSIYSTTDYSGYECGHECFNNHFEVTYSHDLKKLIKYGLTDRARSLLNIKNKRK
jgi:hypothetical protein